MGQCQGRPQPFHTAIYGIGSKVPSHMLLGVVWGAPHGRFHVVSVITPGKRPEVAFVRAAQGRSIPFMVEEPLPAPRPDVDSLRSTTQALWFGIHRGNLTSILENGQIPGGTRSRRKARGMPRWLRYIGCAIGMWR